MIRRGEFRWIIVDIVEANLHLRRVLWPINIALIVDENAEVESRSVPVILKVQRFQHVKGARSVGISAHIEMVTPILVLLTGLHHTVDEVVGDVLVVHAHIQHRSFGQDHTGGLVDGLGVEFALEFGWGIILVLELNDGGAGATAMPTVRRSHLDQSNNQTMNTDPHKETSQKSIQPSRQTIRKREINELPD